MSDKKSSTKKTDSVRSLKADSKKSEKKRSGSQSSDSSTKDRKGKGPADAPAAAAPSSSSSSIPVAAASSSSSSSSAAADPSSALSHLKLLSPDLRELTDVQFMFPEGSHFAHTWVLEQRSPKLNTAVQAGKVRKQKRGKHIIHHYSVEFGDAKVKKVLGGYEVGYTTLKHVLDYVYGDSLDVTKIVPLALLDLYVAASAFGINRLAHQAKSQLNQCLNNENVFVLLKQADVLKQDPIRSMCMEYAHFNVRELIKMKQAAEDLGIVLFHQVAKLSLEPVPESRTPAEACPPSTYVDDFKRLYELTVQKPDQHMQFITCKAKQIRFHSPILAAASPKLTRLLGKELEEDLSKPLMDITPLQVASVHTLLKYLYYGEFEKSPLASIELSPACKMLEMEGLVTLTEENIKANVNATTVLDILLITFLPYNLPRQDMKDLKQSCLDFICSHWTEVNFDVLQAMDRQITQAILKAWQAQCKAQGQ